MSLWTMAKTMVDRSSSVLVVTLCLLSVLCPVNGDQHTAFVLVGATGDLASKYLWQSIFNVYSNSLSDSKNNNADQVSNHSFSFFGVGRSAEEKGTVLLNKKLQDSIQCGVKHQEPSSFVQCKNRKQAFIDDVEYVKSSNELDDFVRLCAHIKRKLSKAGPDAKKDVIMFMAISTTAYISFMENFKKKCDKSVFQSDVNIQWALEKPFGVDKTSAENYADQLLNTFDMNNIHHVDHYLQKSVTKTMLSFRSLNPGLEKVWNKNSIERVEIFLKETLDVRERASFYNSMGVLRDIHQNHLTELLILTAMELPSDIKNTEQISENKAGLLRHVESIKDSTALFGQYANYAKHAALQLPNDTMTVDVPTFAATMVRINSARWRGVPFLLVSGKQLDKRESFVKVVFRDTNVCISQCDQSREQSQPKVVFHIGHGDVPQPSILVSKSFKRPVWPDNISEMRTLAGFNTSAVHQTPIKQFYIGAITNDIPAYQSVISDLVHGLKSHFVTTQRLLLSWRIWNHIVTADKTPRIYDQGDPHGDLNFRFGDSGLEFVHTGMVTKDFMGSASTSSQIQKSPAGFLGRKLVTNSISQLPGLLAKAIAEAAKEDVDMHGIFHIALSGGLSISPVLQSLTSEFASLPWDSIHVWQVDERCVPHHGGKSNFGMLDRELFQKVNIPFSNIHAMPVDIAGELCDENLGGAHLYTEAIKQHVNKAQFDMIVLGVGADGHTASLFPGSPALHVDSETFVTVSDDGPQDSKRRMSLTLPIINRSKNIAVLATGHHKRDILLQLEKSFSLDKYPILGVNPKNGTLTWYIDYAAFAYDDDKY